MTFRPSRTLGSSSIILDHQRPYFHLKVLLDSTTARKCTEIDKNGTTNPQRKDGVAKLSQPRLIPRSPDGEELKHVRNRNWSYLDVSEVLLRCCNTAISFGWSHSRRSLKGGSLSIVTAIKWNYSLSLIV